MSIYTLVWDRLTVSPAKAWQPAGIDSRLTSQCCICWYISSGDGPVLAGRRKFLRHPSLGCRYAENEPRARGEMLIVDCPFVLIDDRPTYRQPESKSVCFGRKKGVKQAS